MTVTTNQNVEFRTDINGLRALAVLGVIAYHFNLPGASGGFVGVDIFFVISGFLMTGMVVGGLERHRFSLVGFYLARARRIVPALLALCVALLALGWLLLLPNDYRRLAIHSATSVLFASNYRYLGEAGYFDTASHEKWLLHTWSLSVEWQFYLLLPLLSLLVWRLRPGRKAQLGMLLLLGLASMLVNLLTVGEQPSAAFFLLQSRAWEMILGGLCWQLSGRLQFRAWPARALSHGGLALAFTSITTAHLAPRWPGIAALAPALAAMVILLAHADARWASNRTMQWLGDRSYSLYLWHWPGVVLLNYTGLQQHPLAVLAAIAAVCLAAHLSYQGIEVPGRRGLSRCAPRAATMALAAALLAVLVPSALVWRAGGVTGRFDAAVEAAAAVASDRNPRTAECHRGRGSASPSCVYGGEQPGLLVVGDSHAIPLMNTLRAALPTGQGAIQWSYSACPLVEGMKTAQRREGKDYRCEDFLSWTTAQLAQTHPGVPVLLVGRYGALAYGRNEDGPALGKPLVFFSRPYDDAAPAFIAEFAQRYEQTVCRLAATRKVLLLRPIPEMGFDVPRALSRRMALGLREDLGIARSDYEARNGWLIRAQDRVSKRCGATVVDPLPFLCDAQRCWGSRDLRPLYFDDNHLSETGARRLLPLFQSTLPR